VNGWYSYHVYGLLWYLRLECRCLFIPGRSAASVCFCISLIMLQILLEAILLVVFCFIGFQPDLLLSAVNINNIAGFSFGMGVCILSRHSGSRSFNGTKSCHVSRISTGQVW
jgi:hypothetical protein